jgi:membrane-bound lytic murein transglycosylase B
MKTTFILKIRSFFSSHIQSQSIRIFACVAFLSATVLYFGLFLGIHTTHAQVDPVAQRQAQLQAELDQVMKEIADQQTILDSEKLKAKSLQGDIVILDAQIKTAQLKIQAHEIAIAGLGKDISQKNVVINTLVGKISDTRDSLAQLLRKSNELDAFNPIDIVLSDKSISDFFVDVDALDSVKQGIQVALGAIRKSKEDTEAAKATLDRQRLQQIDEKISIQDEQAKIKASEKEKARLLSLSKEQQRNYQGEINKRQAKAASIRAALFSLRDTGSISFGAALEYANEASKSTGIRPAFLLAILTQESNLGKNVGSCYLSDTNSGVGKKVSSGDTVYKVMKPDRDITPFLSIAASVGRDPLQTRVSCPVTDKYGSPIGYGGAMGPSQFIPSTWMLFKDRIAQATSHQNPDPWNPEDAFMASAIYLSDLGASDQSYSSERNAACRYYSGRSCDRRAPANSFYGDSVLAKASSIQTNMIDQLNGL